jgi:hypothetical protein
VRLCHASEEGASDHPGWHDIALECADDILGLYGISRFLAHLDRGDRFTDENVIGAILAYIAETGWQDFVRKHGLEERTVLEYRQRYILAALSNRGIW